MKYLLLLALLPSLAFSYINENDLRTSSIVVYYNPAGAPAGVTPEQVAEGVRTWNTAEAGIRAVYGGLTELPPSKHLGYDDGVNVIGWGGTSLGSANYTGAECDIILGATPYDWTYYSAARIAAHEVGHCLGLGHSDVPGSIMWGSVGSATSVTLSGDDIAGLRGAYPPYRYTVRVGLP